ncbi:FAD-dependent oxidoreductase [Propionibacterium freudenreichii]|uniref:FAD-dependent oxidoreductase n=1 Tax=Propionibacterium freudenreichii TaxID=1744 RepID=UPI003D715F2D
MAKHVIVIGAGVVGLACAWRLRRRGHRVTLLDPSPASGASHAAAGMLAAVSEYYFEENRCWRCRCPLRAFTRRSSPSWPDAPAAPRASVTFPRSSPPPIRPIVSAWSTLVTSSAALA